MDLKLDILDLAHARSSHASTRQSVLARNIANADTPGYKAMDLPDFSEAMQSNDSDGMALRTTRKGHMADTGDGFGFRPERTSVLGAESPNGNTVSLEDQMMRSVEAQQSHAMALGVYRKVLDVMRLSIGNR